ncbi:hypothetical protein PCL_07287 [Purpureocillium lilacinum]|uniref:Uncharacterized protein n=1 Tax=Purpureocillium lilacinum TaxID=33203 RepID=A0A2U3DSK4_PURLI|nr:hypothetical protein PCL_07287 [Purpureocillium lilacinum]
MAGRPPNQRVGSSSSSSSSVSSTSALGAATDVPFSRSSWPSVRVTAPQPEAFVEYLRCMRCARSTDMMSTDDASAVGMVCIGFNLYYCNWCAKLVGYNDANASLGRPTTLIAGRPPAAATAAKFAMCVLSEMVPIHLLSTSEMSVLAASCRVPDCAGGDLGPSPGTAAQLHLAILTSTGGTETNMWQLVDDSSAREATAEILQRQ